MEAIGDYEARPGRMGETEAEGRSLPAQNHTAPTALPERFFESLHEKHDSHLQEPDLIYIIIL